MNCSSMKTPCMITCFSITCYRSCVRYNRIISTVYLMLNLCQLNSYKLFLHVNFEHKAPSIEVNTHTNSTADLYMFSSKTTPENDFHSPFHISIIYYINLGTFMTFVNNFIACFCLNLIMLCR